jgi:hypothetical protein
MVTVRREPFLTVRALALTTIELYDNDEDRAPPDRGVVCVLSSRVLRALYSVDRSIYRMESKSFFADDAMSESDKSVFISYRRKLGARCARAIWQDHKLYGYDVFVDVESIDNEALACLNWTK